MTACHLMEIKTGIEVEGSSEWTADELKNLPTGEEQGANVTVDGAAL